VKNRLALTFYSVLKMPISDIISCSIEAERAGFECISVAESFYRDASVLSSAIATNTTKIKLGSSGSLRCLILRSISRIRSGY